MSVQINGVNADPDIRTTLGLLGDHNSLAYRVAEIEKHFHSYEHWFGLAAVPNGEVHRADHLSVIPFQMDAGDNTWGTWLQVLGSDDTPHVPGCVEYDFHMLLITDVERDTTITLIQIGYGDSGADAITNDDITEKILTPLKNARQDPTVMNTRRISAGTKAWIRCWVVGQNTGEVDLYLGLHEYEG